MDIIKYNMGMLGITEKPERVGSIGLANEASFDGSFLSQPLTDYAVGYLQNNQELIDLLEFLAPSVRVGRRFEFKKANRNDAFIAAEKDEDVRALGGEFRLIRSTGEIEQAKTLSKGLTKPIDIDEIRDNPHAEEEAVRVLLGALIRAEILRAVVVLNAAATNEAKTWSTGADADADLLAMLSAGGDGAGLDPNRIVFGSSAWQNRVKGLRALATAGGFATSSLTTAALAEWLAVDGVKVGRHRYTVGSGKQQLVTSNVVLAYNAQAGATREDPSNIKRFVSPSEGGEGCCVFRQQISASTIHVTVSHYSNIVLTSSSGVRKLTIS